MGQRRALSSVGGDMRKLHSLPTFYGWITALGIFIPVFALILLLLAVAHHLQPLVWSAYPLWYHLVFWAYLVPLTLLGGRLASARKD